MRRPGQAVVRRLREVVVVERPVRRMLEVLGRGRARVEEVEREVRRVDRQRPRRDGVLGAVRHGRVCAEGLAADRERVATVVRRADDGILRHEVVVRDVDVLPRGRDPRAIVLERRLGAVVERLALILRDLDGGPTDVEVGREQVPVRVHRDVLVAASQRAVQIERHRLRPRLAAVVGMPLERPVGIADGGGVDVTPARGRRRVDRQRGLGSLPARQHDVAAERRSLCATRRGRRRLGLRGRARRCEHGSTDQHGQQEQTSHRSRPPEKDSHNPIKVCRSRGWVMSRGKALQTRCFSTDQSVTAVGRRS